MGAGHRLGPPDGVVLRGVLHPLRGRGLRVQQGQQQVLAPDEQLDRQALQARRQEDRGQHVGRQPVQRLPQGELLQRPGPF